MPRKHPSTPNPGSTFKKSIFHHLKAWFHRRSASSVWVGNRARIARQSSTTWLPSLVRLRPPQPESLSWRREKKTWRVFKRVEGRGSGGFTKSARAAHFSGHKPLSSETWARLMWWQFPCAFDYWRENRDREEGKKRRRRERERFHTRSLARAHMHTPWQDSIISMIIQLWPVNFNDIRFVLGARWMSRR